VNDNINFLKCYWWCCLGSDFLRFRYW